MNEIMKISVAKTKELKHIQTIHNAAGHKSEEQIAAEEEQRAKEEAKTEAKRKTQARIDRILEGKEPDPEDEQQPETESAEASTETDATKTIIKTDSEGNPVDLKSHFQMLKEKRKTEKEEKKKLKLEKKR